MHHKNLFIPYPFWVYHSIHPLPLLRFPPVIFLLFWKWGIHGEIWVYWVHVLRSDIIHWHISWCHGVWVHICHVMHDWVGVKILIYHMRHGLVPWYHQIRCSIYRHGSTNHFWMVVDRNSKLCF